MVGENTYYATLEDEWSLIIAKICLADHNLGFLYDMIAHIMIGNKMSDHRLLFVDLHLVHVWVDQWWEAFLVQSLSYVMQQTMHQKLEVWIEETTGRCTWRLDYQLLLRKMSLCSSPQTPSGTRLERAAEIEPNVYGELHTRQWLA